MDIAIPKKVPTVPERTSSLGMNNGKPVLTGFKVTSDLVPKPEMSSSIPAEPDVKYDTSKIEPAVKAALGQLEKGEKKKLFKPVLKTAKKVDPPQAPLRPAGSPTAKELSFPGFEMFTGKKSTTTGLQRLEY